jgi:hypothetical protein
VCVCVCVYVCVRFLYGLTSEDKKTEKPSKTEINLHYTQTFNLQTNFTEDTMHLHDE